MPGRYNRTLGICFFSLAVIAAFVLLRSPLFQIQQITVQGNITLSRDRVVDMSGLVPGQNIFKVDLGAARARLLSLPAVKDCSVSRRLPDRIIIVLQERRAAAALPAAGGLWLVDDGGVVIGPATYRGLNLPLITGAGRLAPQAGRQLEDAALRTALAVVQAWPGDLLARLAEIHVQPEGSITVYTLPGIPCRVGRAEDLSRKGQLLQELLQQKALPVRQVQYIDVSSTSLPVIKYKTRTG
ncbi:MAG: cell division protein FtsQ/DivIB [Desulfurispora sp.]|uniref:cell division protein FtsQ/DivIB n=1 Tax=Desulfurispora sp. TaxID=3014275 RepID=UPI00404A38E9